MKASTAAKSSDERKTATPTTIKDEENTKTESKEDITVSITCNDMYK